MSEMSEISMSEEPFWQQIDLTTLDLQQLTALKLKLDSTLRIFQDSVQNYKIAQTKFQESGSCLEKVTPDMEGNEVLVPLTGSMYVVGKLVETNKVLLDIGTGYYIQKNISDAKEYCEGRVGFIITQMAKIQQLGLEKSKVRDAVVDMIEMKLQNQMKEEEKKEGSEHI